MSKCSDSHNHIFQFGILIIILLSEYSVDLLQYNYNRLWPRPSGNNALIAASRSSRPLRADGAPIYLLLHITLRITPSARSCCGILMFIAFSCGRAPYDELQQPLRSPEREHLENLRPPAWRSHRHNCRQFCGFSATSHAVLVC